ncbi:MAG: hypothetical protein PVJ02_13880 [Gemmatimonadota bacterium]
MPLCLTALLALGACGDAPTDPLVGIVAEETHAAMALGFDFAEPGTMAPQGTLSDEGLRALDAWRASWDEPEDLGREIRERSYAALADALAPAVGDGELGRQIALLRRGVERARTLLIPDLPAYLGDGIGRAAAAWREAEAARARGDARTAIAALLRGSDDLREVGPEAVARSLQETVELEYRRLLPADSYPQADRERLDRLVHGGRQALSEGKWVLAIRRAYYARALLNAR